MSYFLMWLGMTVISSAVLIFATIQESVAISPIVAILVAAAISAFCVANELKRPEQKEYNRKKALYPIIPDKYLHQTPISESVVFGTDYHTGKFVQAEPGHSVMIVGSTGSGKTATSLIPSILSCNTGSKQVVDIKSHELLLKTHDLHNKNSVVVDFDSNADFVWGWDIFYKLRKDGTDTEQEVLEVIREVASIIIPNTEGGEQFWIEAARNEFIALAIFQVCYKHNYEFIDVCHSILTIGLREHMESALNSVKTDSIIIAYLSGLSSTNDDTLFSINITLNQALFIFLSAHIIYLLRDNPKRTNPLLLDKEGTSQYLCVSEEKLDSGYDKIMNVILKQTMLQIQSRTTTGTYPQTQLYYDEFQKLSESCQSQRQTISSFLKTSRSKHASVVLCVQNLDNWKKDTIYDILSNIHFLYVLASNNANSLTSEIVCKMAGSYYEKEKSYSQSDRASISTSFKEKQILRPEDLNQLGNDGVLLITNHGYVRTNKLGSAYFSVQPFKSQYEAINAVNKEVMKDM